MILFCVIALTLVGCCTAPPGDDLPMVQGQTDQQVLDALAKRSGQVKSVMSSGTMRLQTDDNGSVKLDVALLAQGNNQLRLRAWKLGRAVFDLTRDGDAVWVWATDRVNDPDDPDALAMLPTAEQIDLGWRLISGQLFASPPNRIDASGKLIVSYAIKQLGAGPVTAQLAINRTSQTIEQILILDAKGLERAKYTPSGYRLIDGIPWATRIAFESESFAFEIELDEVELNGTLPKSAFTPPRDARKQP
jgi:hypothetical protein